MQEVFFDKNLQSLQVSCLGKNPMASFCFESECNSGAVLCQNKNSCKCYQDHVNCCYFVDAKRYLNILQSKRQPLTQPMTKLLNELDELYEKAIQKMSQHREFFQMYTDKYGLSQKQRNLFMLMQNNQIQKITGRYLNQIKLSTGKIVNLTFQEEVKRNWPQKKAQFFRSFRNIQFFFESLSCKIQSLLRPKFEIQSNIIKDAGILQDFLNDGVRQFRRVYNSLQSVELFEDLAGPLKHTIIIVQTQQGAIFGGYNPKNWMDHQERHRQGQQRYYRHRRRQDNGDLSKDLQGQSFIFSYTNRQKFPIVRKQMAFSFDQLPGFGFYTNYDERRGRQRDFNDFRLVYQDNDYDRRRGNQPIRGRQKFLVSVGFPISYNNGKYIKGYQAIKAFSGGYNEALLNVREWEAFQVIWIDDHKNQKNGSELIAQKKTQVKTKQQKRQRKP